MALPMKIGSKGFGLLELMIAIVLSTIVMLGIYQYWIKGLGTMTDSVKISAIKGRAQLTFNNIISDLKLIGYNPRQKLDPYNCSPSTSPCPAGNRLPFGIIDLQNPFDSITYSFYNEDSDDDPGYTRTCIDPYCTRSRYYLNNGTLMRTFFDSATNQRIDQMLLQNACVRFLTGGTPIMITLILAIALDESLVVSFDANCQIPGQETRYVRFEKQVHLTNLR